MALVLPPKRPKLFQGGSSFAKEIKKKKRARILLNLYIVVLADLDSRLLIIRRSVLLATAAFPHHFVSKTLNEDLKLSFDML